MVAGLGAYGRVLADPSARAFSLAGFVARLPLSMTGLGIVLLDLHHHRLVRSRRTGHRGRHHRRRRRGAGLGPADRPGRPGPGAGHRHLDQQRQPGRADHQRAAGLAAGQRPWPPPSGSGLGFSSAGACVRARWTHRLRGTALLNTAFAWEAVVDEVVFIVGPVLATFLATSIHPALGLATGAVLGLIGSLALAAQRGTEPPVQPTATAAAAGQRLSPAVLVPIVLAYAALGALFGGMEVVIVAFAEEAGVLPLAGFLIMAWASGSLDRGRDHRRHHLAGQPAAPVPDRGRRVGRLAGAAAVRRPAADHRGAADRQRSGHRADVDRVGRGDLGGRAADPADRGAGLGLDGAGLRAGDRRRRVGSGDRRRRGPRRILGRGGHRRAVDHLGAVRPRRPASADLESRAAR